MGSVQHSFFYPDEKEDYAVLQFATPAAGGSGLASLVEEASQAAIKARFWRSLPLGDPVTLPAALHGRALAMQGA